MTGMPMEQKPDAIDRSRAVLGLGLITAGLAAILWPLFTVGQLGYLCSPPTDPQADPVCAGGASYLFSFLHTAMASVVAIVLILVAFRALRSSPTYLRRTIFAMTAIVSPALIVLVVLDSPPVDFTPALPALSFATVATATCIGCALVRAGRTRITLTAASALAGAVGVIIEPGVASPLLMTVVIAIVLSMSYPNTVPASPA